MEAKQFIDSLEANVFNDKKFKYVYLFLAYWAVLAPILTIFLFLVNIKVEYYIQHIIIALIFCLTKIVEVAFNFKALRQKKLDIIEILMISLFLWFMIVSVITGAINANFLFGFMLFVLFALFCNVNKKFLRTLALVFIIEMVCESILGLIDIHNKFIPGFSTNSYPMSMHFINPNWSGFVLIIAEIACLWFILDSKKDWQKILFFAGYVIMAICLFVGGSYAPEASLFLCELALVIYLWVKYKKCPWWILSALLSTIFISFAVWWFPKVKTISTARANFFYESLGVIDFNLNTNLVETVSSIFNKIFGWDKKSVIAGADGWTRSDLNAQAWDAILTSFESFMLGYGSKYIYTIHVHDCFLVLWMEFGLPAILIFSAICVIMLIRFIRVKKTDLMVFLFSCFCMMLFEFSFCCIEPACFQFFVMLAVFLYKCLYSAELKKLKQPEELKEDKLEKLLHLEVQDVEPETKELVSKK